MTFETDWNINKYKKETEYEVHWQLRKSFMETHKDKYPEDKLVTLSQLFANMELMGCIYNSELMLLIQNLAKQVDFIVQYREGRKNAIRRTFVKGSDACKRNDSESTNHNKRKQPYIEFEKDKGISKNKKNKSSTNTTVGNNFKMNDDDWNLFCKIKAQPGIRGKFIIFKIKESSHDILTASAAKLHMKFQFTTENLTTTPNLKIHELKIDNETVVFRKTTDKLTSSIKRELSQEAYDYLEKYCFKIIPTHNFEKVDKSVTQSKSEVKKIEATKCEEKNLYGGVGAKIMKLMGWKGEGLGKNSTGITEPVEAGTLNVTKAGLGTTKTDSKFSVVMRKYLKTYVNSNEERELQFTSEYTKEERKIIHQISVSLSLRSQSYGKDNNRAIRVSKKISGWDLVQNLLSKGGSTAAHTLIKPTALT